MVSASSTIITHPPIIHHDSPSPLPSLTPSLEQAKPLPPRAARRSSCSPIPIRPVISHIRIPTILVRPPRAPLLLARAEAREEYDEHAEEQQDHGREYRPHAHGVVGVAAGAVGVDVVFDDLLVVC